MMTIFGELVAKQTELGGYVTYVFRNKETDEMFEKYIMCTRYPNWEAKAVPIGQSGYVTLDEHKAGEDSWYDGKDKIGYKYDHIQFISFIPRKENNTDNIITL